ncbi:leucine-rich repeat-containing protein 15-like [Ptychodera flava]|uniref:leucine-rich repeat-containing protein 15-like n=1 Tax=Ptychodera flava TaxID=63121 RepID=UPI003969FD85
MMITRHWFTLFLSVINLSASQSEPICKVYKTNRVDCSGRELNNLPQNIPSYTTDLDLYNNNIASLPPNGFVRFKQLHSLVLSSNRITSVDSTSLKGLKNLQYLSLSGNKIVLTLDAFKDLSKLKVLSLSSNSSIKIPNDLFSPLKNLKNLSLSDNHFLILSSISFHKLGSLQTLDLSSTGISILPDGIFESLANLKELALKQNDMVCFPNNALQVLTNIENIYFDDNKMNQPSCTDIILKNFQKLKMLSLSSSFTQDAIIPNFIFADKKPHETDFEGTKDLLSQQGTFDSANGEPIFTISLYGNNINADSLERLLYDFKYSKIRKLSWYSGRGLLSHNDRLNIERFERHKIENSST